MLAFFNAVVWSGIAGADRINAVYFLNVGQGDAELIVLKDGTSVLIDGGPSEDIVYELEKILPSGKKYIDLVVLTHPDYDHYAGLIDVLDYYRIGAFIHGPAANESAAYAELEDRLGKFRIDSRPVLSGSRISIGSAKMGFIHSLGPRENSGKDDDSLIMFFDCSGVRTLFAADAETATLLDLDRKIDLKADILKIPHHGSRFGLSDPLLADISPSLAVIEVGKNNYGHPAEAVIAGLERRKIGYFRTDRDGTIKISLSETRVTASKIR